MGYPQQPQPSYGVPGYPPQQTPAGPVGVRAVWQRWEYRAVGRSPRGAEAKLNELGREGWELVYFDPDTKQYVFKRPAG